MKHHDTRRVLNSKGAVFHLRYTWTTGVSLDRRPQLLEVDLVRRTGTQALFGNYIMEIPPRSNKFSVLKHFVAAARQTITLTGCAELEPGDLLDIASASLLRVPVAEHERRDEPHPDCDAAPAINTDNVEPSPAPEPPPNLPRRLDADQLTSFLRVWDTLRLHLRGVSFDLEGKGWSPAVIAELGNTLRQFADVFCTSPTDFGGMFSSPIPH